MNAVIRPFAMVFLALMAAIPAVRLIATTQVPYLVIVILLVYAALSALRPLTAWLILCGVFPVIGTIKTLAAVPWENSQAAVTITLAFISGWFIHSARTGTPIVASTVAIPFILYVSLIGASAATYSLVYSGWDRPLASRLQTVLSDLSHIGVTNEPTTMALHAALGLTVFAAASVFSARGFGTATRRTLVVGLAVAATINVARFLQLVSAAARPFAAIAEYGRALRINVQYNDLNAAGSSFALGLLTAVGEAVNGRGLWRHGFAVCAVLLTIAVWLAGSRVALASTVLAVIVVVVWRQLGIRRSRGVWYLVGPALVVAAILVSTWILFFFRSEINTQPSSALAIRIEFFSRAGRMLRDSPLMGIGIGRFYPESLRYSTPRSFGAENSHNTLAQIAAELGVVGLVTFLWLIAASVRPLVKRTAPGAKPSPSWMGAGLLAYFLSGMGGHPLIVFESAVPFWILLGVLAGSHADGAAASTPASRWRRFTAGVAVALLLTIPVRAEQFMRWRHFYEFSGGPWKMDETTRYRNVGTRDFIFVTPPVSAVILPLRLAPGSTQTGRVTVILDGQPANQFGVTDDEWRRFRLILPPSGRYDDRKIELRLEEPSEGGELLVGRMMLEK